MLPVLAALVISLPLGYLVFRTGKAANAILAFLGVIYSIPSLALFVALPLILGTGILAPINIAVALAIYSVALLVRSVVDGLRSVPFAVKQSASAIGFGWFRRLVRVELPLAMPVIFAGLRVVTVSNIALVSVAVGGGQRGPRPVVRPRSAVSAFFTPVAIGLMLTACCSPWWPTRMILLIQRGTLPWAREDGGPRELLLLPLRRLEVERHWPEIGRLLVEHLEPTPCAALAIAAVIAVPLGVLDRAHRAGQLPGHRPPATPPGPFPAIGLLVLVVLLLRHVAGVSRSCRGAWPCSGCPPILTATAAGSDRVRTGRPCYAARALGMTGGQIDPPRSSGRWPCPWSSPGSAVPPCRS